MIDKIKALSEKLISETPFLSEVEPDQELVLFDPSNSCYRSATQEDIDRLQVIEQEYGKLLSFMEHQINHTELYSDGSPSYEEILERNKRLKWGAFA